MIIDDQHLQCDKQQKNIKIRKESMDKKSNGTEKNCNNNDI